MISTVALPTATPRQDEPAAPPAAAQRPSGLTVRPPAPGAWTVRTVAQIWRLFTSLDVDGSGRISSSDLQKILAQPVPSKSPQTAEAIAAAEVRQLAQRLLADPQSLARFTTQTASSLLAHVGQAVHRHFAFLDTAATPGKITWADLRQPRGAVDSLEWGEHRETRAALVADQKLFQALSGQDGVITKADLARFLPRPAATPLPLLAGELWRAFDALDAVGHRDGQITAIELYSALNVPSLRRVAQRALAQPAMLRQLAGGDSGISKADLLRAVAREVAARWDRLDVAEPKGQITAADLALVLQANTSAARAAGPDGVALAKALRAHPSLFAALAGKDRLSISKEDLKPLLRLAIVPWCGTPPVARPF